MSSIRKEVVINAPAEHVWGAIRDYGEVHHRVATGFVTDCKLDGPEARIVTFANGTIAREILVDRDDKARRLVYSVTGSPRLTHHNASFEVFPESNHQCRVVWIADLLPAEIAPYISGQMDLGAVAMRRNLATSENRET